MAKRKRERLGEPRRYTFKLYPNKAQHAELMRQARMMGELWNALLSRNEQMRQRTKGQKGVVHAEGKQLLSYEDMTMEITQLRHACPEWADLSVGSERRVCNALAEAFKAFFRRMKELSNPAVYEREAAAVMAKPRRDGKPRRKPTRFDLAGYPKYRSLDRADWVPFSCRSGFKLQPHGDTRKRPNGRESATEWRLTRIKGLHSAIRARGELPGTPVEWTDADLRYERGNWRLSVAADLPKRREADIADVTIRFDLINRLADVTGANIGAPDFSRIMMTEHKIDALKSERDIRWPWKPGQRACRACQEASRRISRLSSHTARARRELLHEWTTEVVSRSGSITIIAPPVKEATRTARGNIDEWGGAVHTVAALNRNILSKAPASAIQMLKYKAAEAGIPCFVVEESEYRAAVGRDLSMAVKVGRKVQRKCKE